MEEQDNDCRMPARQALPWWRGCPQEINRVRRQLADLLPRTEEQLQNTHFSILKEDLPGYV